MYFVHKTLLAPLLAAMVSILFMSGVKAENFSFMGSFAQDDEVQSFAAFTVGTSSVVTLRTLSYAGGVNASSQIIRSGGFDPILAVFDSQGRLIGQNDDGGPDVPADPVTGAHYDTFLAISLPPGTYTVCIMQFNNFANGPNLSNGFVDTGRGNFTAASSGPLGATGPFWDATHHQRDSHWAFDILNVNQAQAIPKPAIKISAVGMINPNVLGLSVGGKFTSSTAIQKIVTINATVNGTAISVQHNVDGIVQSDGTFSDDVFIDLAQAKVQRFSDNQVFSVTASASQGGSIATTTHNVEIPLPVVHVHGMATEYDDDIHPHKLFDLLKQNHNYNEDDGLPGPPLDVFHHNLLSSTYPTLVSFDYQSFTDDISTHGDRLANFIKQELLPRTYAAKVNIVAHSLGGIVSRNVIANNGGGDYINKLILVGSPSEGAPLILNLKDNKGAVKGMAGAVWGYFQPGLVGSVTRCIWDGNDDAIREMCPTYQWWSWYPTNNISQRQIPPSERNFFLENLNGLGLNPNVEYFDIVASGYHNFLIGGFGDATLTGLWGHHTQWVSQAFGRGFAEEGPGDGVVPIRSQTAEDTNWPPGTGRGKWHIYADVGNVFHTDYFDAVGSDGKVKTNECILNYLWSE